MSGMPSLHQQPAWFGAVMGTGAIGILFNLQDQVLDYPLLGWLAIGFLWLATALAVVLWPRYFRRLSQRDQLREEIADPGHGAMLATVPAGLLVLAVVWGSIGPATVPADIALWVAVALTVLGTVIALGYSALWATSISTVEVPLGKIHGGWMIPVVMPLLVPVALAPIMHHWPDTSRSLLVVGFAFLGIGTLLFLGVFSLFVLRLATQTPLPNPMSPSMWIPLAPAGVFGIAVIRLTQAAEQAGLVSADMLWISSALAAMGVGFGLWWALFAYVDLRRVRAAGGIPFHLGWWGFVFPVAAMALSITLIGQVADFSWWIGSVFSGIAVIVWAVVAGKTAQAVRVHSS